MIPHYADDALTVYLGDCLDILPTIPDGTVDAVVTDLAAGIAAEHLVCADLLLAGRRAFLTDQNCPYDVAVEASGRLVRIQVKATRQPRTIPQRTTNHRAGYLFQIRRGGKGGQRRYGVTEFDMVALVALDARRIAYMPIAGAPSTVIFRAHDDPTHPRHGGKCGRVFDNYPFAVALGAIA